MLVESEADVDALEVDDPERRSPTSRRPRCASTRPRTIIARLRERFPHIAGPRTDDICYATTNRQAAVKQMAAQCDLVLVIGSHELVELATGWSTSRATTAPTSLSDRRRRPGRRRRWLEGARVVGITSGASAPEELVTGSSTSSATRGTEDVAEFEVLREDVRFMLPKTIRQAMTAAAEA